MSWRNALIQWEVQFAQAHLVRFLGSVILNIFLVIFVLRLIKLERTDRNASEHGSGSRMTYLPGLLFLALFCYQAGWQMFGFLDPGFLRVQRGFDPRENLVGSRFERGTILDANGEPLAWDTPRGNHLIRCTSLPPSSVHLIGYHHPVFGSSGLEAVLDARLMGREMNSIGDVFRLLLNGFVHGKLRGNPIRLTIVKALQEAACNALGAYNGAIVAVDPRNGAVLAMASSPGFAPGRLDKKTFNRLRTRKDSPFLNRATNGLYAPGSTFKVLLVMRTVELGKKPVFTCGPQGFYCGKNEPAVNDYGYYVQKKRGRHYKGHGRISLIRALNVSCNVYFAQLGQELGLKNVLDAAHRAGLDMPIHPAGPGLSAAAGRIPALTKVSRARLARLSIGQDDLLVTPLHLALMTAALGSDGREFNPIYVQGTEPEVRLRLTDPRTATDVARKMIQVVEFGTGTRAKIPGIIVGGKTGTVENSSGKSHAIFIGFAPWPHPTIAISVILEQAGLGGKHAAPAAAAVLKKADEIGWFTSNPDGMQ